MYAVRAAAARTDPSTPSCPRRAVPSADLLAVLRSRYRKLPPRLFREPTAAHRRDLGQKRRRRSGGGDPRPSTLAFEPRYVNYDIFSCALEAIEFFVCDAHVDFRTDRRPILSPHGYYVTCALHVLNLITKSTVIAARRKRHGNNANKK